MLAKYLIRHWEKIITALGLANFWSHRNTNDLLVLFLGESESRMWICKPTGQNQGKGILLLESPEDAEAFRLQLQHLEAHRTCRLNNQPYIAQQWVLFTYWCFLMHILNVHKH